MRNAIYLISALLLVGTLSLLCKSHLSVGCKSPDFSLQDEQGNIISLSQFQGQRVALMFYPSIKTPNCKKEVCSIANDFRQLQKHNIIVLGISYNSIETNKKFSKQNNVGFPLLYDKNKKVTKAYGVDGWMFPSRKTFLINEKGVIVKIIDNVKVDHHTTQIINGFLLS